MRRLLCAAFLLGTLGNFVGCGDETFDFPSSGGSSTGGDDTGNSTGGDVSHDGGGACGDSACAPVDCSACRLDDIACSPGDDSCVRCDEDFDCNEYRSCDPLVGRCQRACDEHDDCPDSHPLCDEDRGTCVDCFRDAHCGDGESCLLGYCVDCDTDCD